MNDPTHPTQPIRPADIGHDVVLAELARQYHVHVAPLVDARHGIGEPVPPGQLAGHAIAALAAQHALAERALHSRWCNAVEALTYGATLDQVAASMDLTVDEVSVGLRSWADGQRHHGGLSDAERDEVYVLAAGGER